MLSYKEDILKFTSRFSYLTICAAALWSFSGVALADSDYSEYKQLRNSYDLGNPFTADAKARFELLNEQFEVNRFGTLDERGGPDNFGYNYVDNLDGDTATYSWIELEGDANAVWPNFDSPDDAGVIVPLSFYFPFYGASHNEIRINSNGLIEFSTTSAAWNNQCLPAAGLEGPAVLCFWDDLHMSYGGNGENTNATIAYRDFADYMVIEYNSIGHNGVGTPPTDSYTFEVILFANGRVKLQYSNIDYSSYSESQTIGIQADASGPALEYSCEAVGTPATDNMAIWFYLAPHSQLSGFVRNQVGMGLANVGVTLEGTEMYAYTDGSGQFFFPTTPLGQYNVHASLLGYRSDVVTNVNVVEGQPTTVDLTLTTMPSLRVESTHAPLAVTDLDTVTATINITTAIDLEAVGVRIDNLTHGYDDDLAMWLQSPWGERVLLSYRHGGSGDDYLNTQFDDLAVRGVALGNSPFTGRFLPDEPLSPLAGHSSVGTWTLILYDHAIQDEGTLNDWSLILVGGLSVHGTLAGQITSDIGGSPIENALVAAPEVGLAELTDANGNYSLELPAGVWDIEVSAVGHCARTIENITISNGVTSDLDSEMDITNGEANVESLDELSYAGEVTTETFDFVNTGLCEIAWTAQAASSGWLSIDPVAGSLGFGQSQTFTVTYDASDLGAGVYDGSITIGTTGYYGSEEIGVTLDIAEAGNETPATPPAEFSLQGNYPNPFNATTEIRYDLAAAGYVNMTVYNLLGQEVRTLLNGVAEAGHHTVYWDGRNAAGADLSTGIYIVQMRANGRLFTGKSMLIR
jgi:subtilisin-like proprotein convertase family protein